VAGAGAQSYNSAGAGDEKPEFAQHYGIPGFKVLDKYSIIPSENPVSYFWILVTINFC
jgi:hypothetical protein